jgi:hypothetical protein
MRISTVVGLVLFGLCAGCRTSSFEARAEEPEAAQAATVPLPANTHARLLEKRSYAMKAAAAAGATRRPVAHPATAYEPRDADRSRGMVFYQPDLKSPFKGQKPSPQDVERAVTLEAAGDETESAVLAVWALKPHARLTWKVSDRPAALGDATIEILPVLTAPVKRSKTSFDLQAVWIADRPAPVDLESDERAAWLVRIRVPKGTTAGTYRMSLTYACGGGAWRPGPAVTLRVFPFDLVDPWEKGYVFGAFCAGADFNTMQYRQMKAHGIEGIQWFWGHYGLSFRRVINDNGTLRMDFSPLDKTIRNFKAAGLRGPIVLAFGNYYASQFERAICRAFNRPTQPEGRRKKGRSKGLATLDDPKTEELMVEALRQLFDHAAAEQWPEIVILPYDEPTMLLMKEHRRMVRLIRTHFPQVRLYGCSMNKLRNANKVADCHIVVSNGDFAAIRKMTRQKKLTSWFYGGATVEKGYQRARWRFGLHRYCHHPEGSWFWSMNYYSGDPWNEFDSRRGDSQWIICWPPLEEGAAFVDTIPYEGLREGADDVRYAMTLESMLEKANDGPAHAVRADYEKWLAGVRKAKPKDRDVPGYRASLVEFLLRLQR